jgi:hypothetical protein
MAWKRSAIVDRILSMRSELEQYPEDQRAEVLKTWVGRARSQANRRLRAKRRAFVAGVEDFEDTSDVFDGRP